MSVPTRRILEPIFGAPALVAQNNAKASWVKGSQILTTFQKGGNGWLASLYSVNSGDDYAGVNISVNNEMHTYDFNSAMWSYYMTAAENYGVNMVIWVHDPDDFDKRAEITQQGDVTGLEKGSGWNAHELNTATTQFFFYGENTTGTSLTAGTQYSWAQFQADALFSKWTIYRISFEWGWIASGTFNLAYLAEVKLNGEIIPLGPKSGKHMIDVVTTKTIIGGAATANDVISNSADAGTDWDFYFGGTGYITKGIVTIATHGLTERLRLFLYSVPPTSTQNDNVASTDPLAADIPNLVGWIDFPAMTDTSAAGISYTMATTSTTGNLPITFDAYTLYGTLIGLDGGTLGNVLCTIKLFADMEDN